MNELKIIRQSLGFSQEKMAEYLGVKRITVVRNEKRKLPPKQMLLAALYLRDNHVS